MSAGAAERVVRMSPAVDQARHSARKRAAVERPLLENSDDNGFEVVSLADGGSYGDSDPSQEGAEQHQQQQRRRRGTVAAAPAGAGDKRGGPRVRRSSATSLDRERRLGSPRHSGSFRDAFQSIRKRVKSVSTGLSIFHAIEQRSGIPRMVVALVLGFAAVLLIFRGFGLSTLVTLFVSVYPVYSSFKTIEMDATRSRRQKDMRRWLSFWVVFAVFTLTQDLADSTLAWWVPFYHPLKLAVLVWCFTPRFKGSQTVYEYIQPFMLRHGPGIERALASGFSVFVSLFRALSGDVANRLRESSALFTPVPESRAAKGSGETSPTAPAGPGTTLTKEASDQNATKATSTRSHGSAVPLRVTMQKKKVRAAVGADAPPVAAKKKKGA